MTTPSIQPLSDPVSAVLLPVTVPPLLARVLQRAHAAEQVAAGEQRRPAFRLTRELIGAAVGCGVAVHAIAQVLDALPGTVRNRISRHEGWLTAAQVTALTDLSPDALGLTPIADASGRHYGTSAVVHALLGRHDDLGHR